ncbi:MAG TPA: PQQ-binding-like beta-propeller repeat protein [bacterium]|nr:PQQ-binding-like beta-propeller repeat protein [bacterium]HPQ66808.1 PQQ-binding-like beta-propeller repeat protein [bacterium]
MTGPDVGCRNLDAVTATAYSNQAPFRIGRRRIPIGALCLSIVGCLGYPAAAVAQAADWPMYLHDIGRNGGAGPIPDNPEVLWDHKVPFNQSVAWPAMTDRSLFFSTTKGYVYRLDLATGDQLWKKSIHGRPGNVVVGAGKVLVENRAKLGGELFCLSPEDGSAIWKTPIPGRWIYSPIVYRGKVYCVSGYGDDELFCLDAATGAIEWSKKAKGVIKTSPLPMDGSIYFGTIDKYLYRVDAVDGTFLWEERYPDRVTGSVSGDGGNIYFACHDDILYCLNGKSGEAVWKKRLLEPQKLTPVLSGGKLVFGSPDRRVHCLDAATGNELWSFLVGDPMISSPVVREGKVLMGMENGYLYCLALDDGRLLWKRSVKSKLVFSPILGGGKIIVGAASMKIYCLGEKAPPPASATP